MAATSNTHFLIVTAMLFVTVGNLILSEKMVSAQCDATLSELASQCGPYFEKWGPKIPPSGDCCRVMKGADIPCVCKQVTSEVEEKIDMEKVVYVFRTCGRTMDAGMKCGSFTVPPEQEN